MLKNPGVTAQQNTLTGLAMSRGIQWQFIASTTNASYIHDNFAIFQRTLSISPDGVMFV